jgi:hypothetical protein
MLSTTKVKWLGSLIVSGFLLVLAVMGGRWGIDYTASAGIEAAPVIDSITPSAIPAGSPDTSMVIDGSEFGTLDDTRVWLTGTGVNQLLAPEEISPEQITVLIPASLLAEPNLFMVTVIKSNWGTVPTIPTIPGDEVSNPVPLLVYGSTYLPYIGK